MFRTRTILANLLSVFTAIAAMLVLLFLGAMVLLRQSASHTAALVEVRLPNAHAIAAIIDEAGAIGRYTYAAINDQLPPDVRRSNFEELETALHAIKQKAAAFDASPKAEKLAAAWRECRAALDAWQAESVQVKDAIAQRDASSGEARVSAGVRMYQQMAQARAGRKQLVTQLKRLDGVVAEGSMADAVEASRALRSLGWALGMVVLTILALCGVSFLFLRRELASFLSLVGDSLQSVAAGELPAPIVESRGSDFNLLRDALNTVSGALRALLADMDRMSTEHARGDIDVVVDQTQYEGAYAKMARGVNEMVGAHIGVKKKAMAVFAEFGRGNFDATLEQLPGKKRFINDTIDQVRSNLKGLITEMNRMSAEHEKGDIDVVIDVGRFQGDFATMARGVNDMVGAHIAVKKQAMGVVGEFGRGNFEAPMPLLPGKKRFINETIEQVRANLKALIADANMLSKAAVEGRLGTRADASKHRGDFRKIVQGVNDTLEAVIAPMRELAVVLDKLAAGELSTRTDSSRYQNESRALVEGVNVTLGALLAPSEEATKVMGLLAQRDLRARMTGNYAGDHTKLKEAVNATGEALHDAIAQVAEAVEHVSSASTQIAASSQAVASGASEQASSLEETSASLESVLSITKQAAHDAQQANILTQTARTAATDGAAAVEQMQGAMVKIRGAAESTSAIIKDINDIAFQTNLLALNAAVEAARAGEAGRGFAVVAEEVRSLALRAKEAAMKTEELIKESVRQAGEGEVTSKHVAAKLAEIVAGIGKVTAIVSDIAGAAKEQSTGIDRVNQAVGEMGRVTQQNAASAEESSSATSELSGQSEELAAMVGAFQIGRSGAEALGLRRPARQAGATALKAASLPARKKNGATGKPALEAVPVKDAFPMDQADGVEDF